MNPRRHEREGPPAGTCRNEGCGRPARESVCDTCALEWDLFHRELRQAGLRRASRTGR
jgi:hypothetical protein